MPDTTTPATEEVHDEPEVMNPVLGDANIKAMGDKFRELMGSNLPDVKKDEPDPLKLNPDPGSKKEGEATEGKADPLDPVRDKLPGDDNPRRLEFRKLEQSRDDYRRQFEEQKKAVEEREAKLKKFEEDMANYRKALPADPEEIVKQLSERETIAKEREELVKTIETINLERSPRFQKWWQEETGKHIKLAQRHVPVEHREEIAKLMMELPSSERDTRIDAIMETLPKVAQRMLTGALENIEGVKLQREEALTRGSEQWKKLQEVERQERDQAKQNMETRISKLTKLALERSRSFESFQEVKDNTEHNAEIRQREAFVTAAIQGKLDEDLAVMLPAAAADSLYLRKNVIPKLKADLEARDKLIRELQSTDPRPNSGTGAKGGNTENATPSEPGSSFATKVRALMGE